MDTKIPRHDSTHWPRLCRNLCRGLSALILFLGNVAVSQESYPKPLQNGSASQSYRIEVRSRIGVTTPPLSVTREIGANSKLLSAAWAIESNHRDGVVVAFEVAEPFVHDSLPQRKADAKISANVDRTSGPATWRLTGRQTQTDHSGEVDRASVQVIADTRGRAEISVDVQFMNPEPGTFDTSGESGMLPIGRYSTHVVCTVTAP